MGHIWLYISWIPRLSHQFQREEHTLLWHMCTRIITHRLRAFTLWGIDTGRNVVSFSSLFRDFFLFDFLSTRIAEVFFFGFFRNKFLLSVIWRAWFLYTHISRFSPLCPAGERSKAVTCGSSVFIFLWCKCILSFFFWPWLYLSYFVCFVFMHVLYYVYTPCGLGWSVLAVTVIALGVWTGFHM